MGTDCLFCRIARREVPATIVYEDDRIVAFDDIRPLAPVHVLLVPRQHFASVADMTEADVALVGSLVWRATRLAQDRGLEADGYRLVFNTRQHAGQVIDHVHLHLLGGKLLGRMAG